MDNELMLSFIRLKNKQKKSKEPQLPEVVSDIFDSEAKPGEIEIEEEKIPEKPKEKPKRKYKPRKAKIKVEPEVSNDENSPER